MNEDLLFQQGVPENANGGTEIMMRRLYNGLPRELLEQCQIIPTRLTVPLDETKVRIAAIHDLPGDPSLDYLKNKGWIKFHRIVFVSNWQMQNFVGYYQIPWSRCVVLKNAIEPIEKHEKPSGPMRLIYTPTPHRGLAVLLPVFQELQKKYEDIHLDVFSSFKLYNWPDRDKEFEPLYDLCRANPGITYHGSTSNEEVRESLKQAHIFAYPSIWNETSCMCLMEAMSAGLVCVHNNLAALFETAANHTIMYQFQEDPQKHAAMFHQCMDHVIENYEHAKKGLEFQKIYADSFYSISSRIMQWKALIESLLLEPRGFEKAEFVYDTHTGQIK